MAKRKKARKKKRVAKKKKVARRRRRKGLWSDSETKVLKKLFSTTPTAEIAKELGRPTDAVKKKASRMGLRKSKRYLRSIGRA
jgi:DNA-directed RNA polymerase specialized sigma24 family protein